MAYLHFCPKTSTLSLLIFLFLSLQMSSSSSCITNSEGPVTPSNPLLSFLVRVQATASQTLGDTKGFDPKAYVDIPLKQDLPVVESAFQNLLNKSGNGHVSKSDFEAFLKEYFDVAGGDVVYHQPVDFVPEPEGFLRKVEDEGVRKWALEVHALWKNLSRKVADEVKKNPERHTLLPLSEPVMIPGARFREVYYWDSYWVIRGLLASKMYRTAKSIVTNLISFIDKYGHVLNGARMYYTNRSQPPFLSAMIHAIYEKTGDRGLVKLALPALLKEYQFWNSDIHKVTIQDAYGVTYMLNRYYAKWNKPRPESGTIDVESASNISSISEKAAFYREVASSAESGWDFSTRWMRDPSDFTTLSTTSILPVDLNAYILRICLRMELDIAFMAKITGDKSLAKRFSEAAQNRKKAFNSIFWNEKSGQWHDYWLNTETGCKGPCKWKASDQNEKVFASNFVPLWIELFHSDPVVVEKVVKSFKASGLLGANGIATSLTRSGQQWDLPNGWAPLQHMIVEGLARSGSKEARALAEDIVIRWIRTNHVSYKQTGVMHEKYDVEKCGEFGAGGEYVPQSGFGWSNGVVLTFLEEFGWTKGLKFDC